MRVGFLTAELAPVAHVGGLGDVSRWLPEALAGGGDEVAVFLPHYDVLPEHEVTPIDDAVKVAPFGSVALATFGARRADRPTVYLIGHDLFRRGSIYGAGPDEHLRYALFTAAVPAVCSRRDWVPDVFHANDWHTALLPALAAAAGSPWDEVPVVLTIHNLAFQGAFPSGDLDRMGLGGLVASDGEVNALAVGIAGAALITTVSPTYATEILTPERGEGLEGALRRRRGDLVGILNGVGPDWDPATDPHIPYPYDIDDLGSKARNTRALRAHFGLEASDAPVLGVVSRLTEQKGFGLLWEALVPLLDRGAVHLAAVGTGDPDLERVFSGLAERFPTRVGFHRGFDTALGHLVEAGSDIFCMPSRFEPCGLNQMYSMRYGTVPVVRRTGGLADTVEPWDPARRRGTGFLFDDFTSEAFARALGEALDTFRDRAGWRVLMENGMRCDLTWEARAEEYRRAYRRAVGAIRCGGHGR